MIIVLCTFVIGYVDPHTGTPDRYIQSCKSCRECGDLVSAFLETGPPSWLEGQTIVPMCLRREEGVTPAGFGR